jgi:high-affinity iron transporter
MMLANFVVGLREGIEAALIVSIIVRYLVALDRRDLLRPLWWGIGLAVGLSFALGAVLTLGTAVVPEPVEESITGLLSIVAVALITSLVLWLARTAPRLGGELRSRVDRSLVLGPAAMVLLGAVTVGREGIETTLFLWAAISASGETVLPLLGALAGLGLAVILGMLLYRGTVTVDLGRFFRWSGAILILVAAGVLAYGVRELQESGVLPGGESIAWDLSAAVPADGLVGSVLGALVGYDPAPTLLQVGVWIAYALVVGALFARALRLPATGRPAKSGAVGGSA